MSDILPADQPYWRLISDAAARVARWYGYRRMDTPVVEFTDLFQRGVGDVTDIVEKEMYSFEDRGGDKLSLRPEATAGAVRAYIQHGMATWPQPVKIYTLGPMFRFDRPQAGRYRQFHQLNAEAMGEPDAAIDAEIIDFAAAFYREVSLPNVSLIVNSIGDASDRPVYIEKLKAYFREHLDALCADCTRRLETNPLRLLDCKQPIDQAISEAAPRSVDTLSVESAAHFDALLKHLTALGFNPSVDHRLVRGLDYYTRTVFEFQPQDVGAQSTIGGGGRYDGLIERLGGKPTPAVGFATGIERIILRLKQAEHPVTEETPLAFVVTFGDLARDRAVGLVSSLRRAGLPVAMSYGPRSAKAQFRAADSSGARWAIILGDDELARGEATVKELATGEQSSLAIESIATLLATNEPG